MKYLIGLASVLLLSVNLISQINNDKNTNVLQDIEISQITLVNAIQYLDTSFTDLPGNGFLIDIGDEILAVTCKHVLWENRQKDMMTIDLGRKVKEWKMYVKNAPSRYVILGELINSNGSEIIGERNTDQDYLVFKIKENHSKIKPLKISRKMVQSGDTLFKSGWSFKNKNSAPQIRSAKAYKYSGSSLLIKNILQQNEAGSSGSPVINKNNELVGIVSSWKYDISSKNWFEAICSTEYLLEVLYSHWLRKNNKTKKVDSFQEFLNCYESQNGYKPEISSFLFTEIFYSDWLKSQDQKCNSFKKYSQWVSLIKEKYGMKITTDDYRKSLLIFDDWKENYVYGKSEIIDLEKALSAEKVDLPAFIDFCEFAKELSGSGEHDKSIALLQYASFKIPNMGQVQAFLGDAFRIKGENELAKEAYLNCLQAYPGYPLAVEGLEKLLK